MLGRARQQILMVADGHYDRLNLWKHLPVGVILLARSARNRVLWHLPGPDARKNRCYGERTPTAADYWRRTGWRGSGRWSLNALWRGYRAALWGTHQFHPIDPRSLLTRGDLYWIRPALRPATFAAARS